MNLNGKTIFIKGGWGQLFEHHISASLWTLAKPFSFLKSYFRTSTFSNTPPDYPARLAKRSFLPSLSRARRCEIKSGKISFAFS